LACRAVEFPAAQCAIVIPVGSLKLHFHETEIFLLAEGAGSLGICLPEFLGGDAALRGFGLAECSVVICVELLESSACRRERFPPSSVCYPLEDYG
jgi:hypothetical protein